MSKATGEILNFIRTLYPKKDLIALHEPVFAGREDELVRDCIRTTMVSSVGEYVVELEKKLAVAMGSKFAVLTSSGTTALQLALELVGVGAGDLVLTQSLTFVATANAISHCGADPVFLDVDRETLGLSPERVREFLENQCSFADGIVKHKASGKTVKACVPMHVLGHPMRIQELVKVCTGFSIPVVEDAAEALGSLSEGKAAGSFGKIGVMSFNGNKIVTTGGGGALVTDDEVLAKRAKHLSTTAKTPHKWEFFHDEVAYNYRMPNLNAALGCAQLEQLPAFLEDKRQISDAYRGFLKSLDIPFVGEPKGCKSNYWLNAMVLENAVARDAFLKEANEAKIFARPMWHLMTDLPMYKDKISGDLENSKYFRDRIVCLPSSVRGKA